MAIGIINQAGLWLGWMHFLPEPGSDRLSVFAKATLAISGSGTLEPIPLEDQPTLDGDRFVDDDRQASCLHPSDFVPFKPKTDLTLTATCHAPGGAPARSVDVRFGLTTAAKTLRVTGDRVWMQSATRAPVPSEPAPFRAMPMIYEHALGGPAFPYNPRGLGLEQRRDTEGFEATPLPNIEDPRQPRRSPQDQVYPAGFAPLNPEWAERRSRLGTYERDYSETRWPAPPADFDWEYYCSAPADQRLDGYLKGDETLVADNLHPDLNRLRMPLPGWRIRCFALVRAGERVEMLELGMLLDTVHVDLHALQVSLVWRANLPVSSREFPEIERIYLAREDLADPPLPADDHRARLLAAIAAGNPVIEPEPEPEEPPAPDPEAPDPEAMAALDKELEEAMAKARADLDNAGLPPEALSRIKAETDPDRFVSLLMAAIAVPQDQLDAAVEQEKQRMRALLEQHGYDPSILDEEVPPEPDPSGLPPEPIEWTREKVVAHGRDGGSFANETLAGLDLSGIEFGAAVFDGAILTGCRFQHSDLRGASLVGASAGSIDLTKADLRGAILETADLAGAIADGVRLDGARLGCVTLTGARLRGASIRSADLSGALLDEAMLAGADLTRVTAAAAVFDRADLSDAVFAGADLNQASVSGARGPRADFTGANLERLHAAESVFPQARFIDVQANYSSFAGGDLREADLTYSQMRRADLSTCDLSGCRFDAVDFTTGIATGSRFRGSRIVASKLFMATLEKADLAGADLQFSCLYAAELLDTDITGAIWDQADLGLTRFDGLIDTGLPRP